MTSFRAASAEGDHWGLVVKACLQQLNPLPIAANLGFVYATEGFVDDLSSIITFLRETTSVNWWLGGVGYGVFGPGGESHGGSALAIMLGNVDAEAVRPFAHFSPDNHAGFLAEHGAWLDRQTAITALVHGDPRTPQIGDVVADFAAIGRAFLVGGLTAIGEAPSQICERVDDSLLSGVLMGDGISLATGLTQGCTPIGATHRITEIVDNVVMQLDGAPALTTLKAEAGEIIARDLKRAAGYIHVAQPIQGSDQSDYLVRGLVGIDPTHGWLAINDEMAIGDRLLFVRRDAREAQKDLQRMLDGLSRRLAGQTIQGGIYISCVARSPHLFGSAECESEMIRETLGDFPMIGFSASGEICHDRLYNFTGVLALFLS
jgi:small ligand-binding sensory domain FIST